MKTQIKVGDSFEVVEVIDANEYSIEKNVFKKEVILYATDIPY